MSSHDHHQLSSAQKQLLAGQLLATDKPLCNMALACSIDGPIDTYTMQCAWKQVASNSDALGIRINLDEDSITQSAGHAWPSLLLLDYSQQSQPQQCAESWMQQIASTAIQPEAVLGHVALIKLSDHRWVFFCNLHHVICDATSFASLWHALASAYFAVTQEANSPEDHTVDQTDFLTFVDATAQTQQNRSLDSTSYISRLQDIAAPAPFGCRPGRDDTQSTRVPAGAGVWSRGWSLQGSTNRASYFDVPDWWWFSSNCRFAFATTKKCRS